MTNNRSNRLKPVLRVAERREQAAAGILARSRETHDEHQQRLQELIDFRHDYARRFNQMGRTGLDAGQMQDFQVFMDRLDQAISEQQQRAASARTDFDACREQWSALRVKAEALARVTSRYQQQEQRDAERREQAEADEKAQYKGARDEGRGSRE